MLERLDVHSWPISVLLTRLHFCNYGLFLSTEVVCTEISSSFWRKIANVLIKSVCFKGSFEYEGRIQELHLGYIYIATFWFKNEHLLLHSPSQWVQLEHAMGCGPTVSSCPSLLTPFFHALTARRHRRTHYYYLWNGIGIELAQGGLSMWACVNLLAGCECIIFHNQPAV